MIFYGPPGYRKDHGCPGDRQSSADGIIQGGYVRGALQICGRSQKKNWEIFFEQAKKSQSILFFDEADVLFGKRTDQKDSNDKYSNAGTAYLLQKIEEYEGIIILATNFLQNFDNAFLRRFQFIIEFPFTDVPRRKEIWQKYFRRSFQGKSWILIFWQRNFISQEARSRMWQWQLHFLQQGNRRH